MSELVTDSIADFMTRIRNAQRVKHLIVKVVYSKVNINLVKILKEEGFVYSYTLKSKDLNNKSISINLKYRENGQPLISEIKRISKPGKRIYLKKRNIPRILDGMGISFISTSKGIMSGKNARINNLGGEYMGYIF